MIRTTLPLSKRGTFFISGGRAFNVAEQPYYLKNMPHNPYMGTTHSSTSTDYLKGFTVKPIHFLYRWRHNYLPIAIPLGSGEHRNRYGKYVHWLQVSTIDKLRVAVLREDGLHFFILGVVTVVFTIYHLARLSYNHPDLSYYNVVLWTTKPFVSQARCAKRHRLDQPIFRYFQRVPEYYMADPYRDLIRLDVLANDPWVVYCKSIGRDKELARHYWDRDDCAGDRGKLLPREIPQEDKHGHRPTVITAY